MPYHALRQQFWRAMLRQYDADESGRISKIELTTMLDTLGSTLKESTIDGFFKRYALENDETGEGDLTFSQAVICLEDQLEKTTQTKKSVSERVKELAHASTATSGTETPNEPLTYHQQPTSGVSGEEGQFITNDLSDESNGEEHVIEIRECPICHQPKLNKRSDTEIVTHIATCRQFRLATGQQPCHGRVRYPISSSTQMVLQGDQQSQLWWLQTGC